MRAAGEMENLLHEVMSLMSHLGSKSGAQDGGGCLLIETMS